MTTFRPHWPRLVVIPTRVGQGLAVTALMAGLAIGASAVANAVPQEWDVVAYDKCVDGWEKRWLSGEISDDELAAGYMVCCVDTGGVISGSGKCVAPALYPEPHGPVAPAPTEASQPPAPAKPVPPIAPRPTVIGPG